MPTEAVNAVLGFHASLEADRKPWLSLWQEVADYLLPKRSAFTSPMTPADNRYDRLFDDTGPWALDQFANGLHSMLTSPLTRWFDLQIAERELRDDREVREWKDLATAVLYEQFNSSVSSFHPTVQEVYTDTGAFGFGVDYSEWSEEDGAVLFQARFPGECLLVEDQYGRVNGVVRKYTLKAHQFVEAFGVEKMPPAEKAAYESGKTTAEFEMIHAVLPKEHPLMKRFRVPGTFKYGSVRVCRKIDEPLAVAGYRSFPFHIARWGKRTGEIYSNSPGIVALPSVRRANAIQMDAIKIINRWADPPVQGPDDEQLAPYDLSPGARNYYRPGTNDRVEAIAGVLGDISPAITLLENTQGAISRAFFADAFLTTADSNGQNVKATFVMQRRNEQFRQLAAMLSRVEREFLGSVIERTFDLCREHNLIPAPPVDVSVNVEYLSPITRAQRSEILDGFNQMIELMAVGAQFDPTVMRSIKWNAVTRDVGTNIHALPAAWFKSEEEVAEEVQAESEQANALTQSQVAKNYGGAIKDVSQADFAAVAE